jgi:predicted DNA-binding transcriptional regulator AlpA
MKMLGPRQAAHKLGVSTRTLDQWRAQHRGPPYIVMEKQIRYEETAIDAWLLSKTIDPEAGQYRFPFKAMIARELEKRALKMASCKYGSTALPQTPLFAT